MHIKCSSFEKKNTLKVNCTGFVTQWSKVMYTNYISLVNYSLQQNTECNNELRHCQNRYVGGPVAERQLYRLYFTIISIGNNYIPVDPKRRMCFERVNTRNLDIIYNSCSLFLRSNFQ